MEIAIDNTCLVFSGKNLLVNERIYPIFKWEDSLGWKFGNLPKITLASRQVIYLNWSTVRPNDSLVSSQVAIVSRKIDWPVQNQLRQTLPINGWRYVLQVMVIIKDSKQHMSATKNIEIMIIPNVERPFAWNFKHQNHWRNFTRVESNGTLICRRLPKILIL